MSARAGIRRRMIRFKRLGDDLSSMLSIPRPPVVDRAKPPYGGTKHGDRTLATDQGSAGTDLAVRGRRGLVAEMVRRGRARGNRQRPGRRPKAEDVRPRS